MRYFISRQYWQYKDLRYVEFYSANVIPTPHTSGYWEHGFEFNNDYFLQLALL